MSDFPEYQHLDTNYKKGDFLGSKGCIDFHQKVMRQQMEGYEPEYKPNPKMYEEYKNKPNFQAVADQQMRKMNAMNDRKYNSNFLSGDYQRYQPNNLYQQFLNQTGALGTPVQATRRVLGYFPGFGVGCWLA